MGTRAGTVPVRGGLGGQLSRSTPSGQDGCFRGRRSNPEQKENIEKMRGGDREEETERRSVS